MRPSVRTAAVLALARLAVACSDATESDPKPDGGQWDAAGDAGGGPSEDSGDSDTGSLPDADPPDAAASVTVPFKIASYPDDGGKLFLVSISVNGSPPIDVLLDTGSNGLLVFEEALQGTAVTVGAAALDAEFGNGEKMVGHVATSLVSFGDVATAEPIDFHLVESFECASWNPSCDFAGGSAAMLTDVGIHGILGTSARRGQPSNVYSPFAQLAPPLRDGYVIHTGGFDATAGEIRFGNAFDDVAGFATIALPSGGAHPNGLPAWGDDRIQACFKVNGAAVAPPCTDVVFDTGSSADIIYAPNLPPDALDFDVLAPGVEFEATVQPVFEMKYTVGQPQTASVDLVIIDTAVPFAILGAGAYLRNDILMDQAGGKIGFKPL